MYYVSLHMTYPIHEYQTPRQTTSISSCFQITALIVIPITLNRGILCGSLIFGGFIFFFLVSKAGQMLMQNYEERTAAEKMENGKSTQSLDISNM